MSKLFALIPAAGSGSRMGGDPPKQYLPLAGKPLLYHALACLLRHAAIERIFVVLAAGGARRNRRQRLGAGARRGAAMPRARGARAADRGLARRSDRWFARAAGGRYAQTRRCRRLCRADRAARASMAGADATDVPLPAAAGSAARERPCARNRRSERDRAARPAAETSGGRQPQPESDLSAGPRTRGVTPEKHGTTDEH